MRRRNLALGALAAGFMVAGVVGGLRADGDEFAWMTDLEAARTKAADEGKPMLLVFR